VINDDPTLTVRHASGIHPLRVVLDRNGSTPSKSAVYSSIASTLLFTVVERTDVNIEQVLLHGQEDPVHRIIEALHARNIRSMIVEGGAELLGHFIRCGMWDEARIITGEVLFGNGTPAPLLNGRPLLTTRSATDRIDHYLNPASPVVGATPYSATWPW
jgi:diaminohydroxyphosphoribosylaminopyrimidine deaminase/5-amino-6-(5-phosphoribosylamino)uracil reductase